MRENPFFKKGSLALSPKKLSNYNYLIASAKQKFLKLTNLSEISYTI